MNALCHRDYVYPGGAIDVAIYDDRVEIWSTGPLPDGIQPEELSKVHRSFQRNPVISRVFYCAGLVEQWGRGTNQIVDLCTGAQLEAPRFVADRANVGVIITAPVGITQTGIESDVVRSLADRKKEILRLLRINSRMSLRDLKKHFANTAERTLQDDLGQLKQLQQIDSQGRGPAAYWHLTNNAE